MRKRMTVSLALMVMAQSIFGGVNFYSYQRVVDVKEHDLDSTIKYDTTISFQQQYIGPAQLERSDITITPKGAYLDIVEDALISGDVNQLQIDGLMSDFILRGSVPLPPKAAVTGLLTWKGDTCFMAELQPSKYNFDRSFIDSLKLTQMLDSKIALLQQQSESYYELTLSRVNLGERKHVRIRYILPNTGSGAAKYSVPVLFNSSSGNPRFVNVSILCNATDRSFYVATGSGDVLIKDTASVSIPYQPQISLNYAPKITSSLQLSSFASGPFRGNYALINTQLDDTILAKLSRPIQTVFLWHWNSPQQFVTNVNWMKGLSQYGQAVIDQAKKMKDAIVALKKRGYRCGLIHSIEGQNQAPFQTASLDDSSATRAINYLSKFDEHYMYNTYVNQADPDPNWVPQSGTADAIIEKSQKDFLAMMQTIKRLFKDTVQYRHIVLLTEGDGNSYYNKAFRDTLSQILDSVTVDFGGWWEQWRGVDLTNSAPVNSLTPYLGFNFPMFFPATVQLQIANGSQPYQFPLDGLHPGTFAVSARTDTEWDTLFSWTGFSSNGAITVKLQTKPTIFRAPMDSGLAKIWARDESHITDREETYPGGTFGILTKATYFQATTKNISPAIAHSIPFLTDDEIHANRTAIIAKKASAFVKEKIEWRHGILTLTSPAPLTKICLYDLAGRLIATIDPMKFAAGQTRYVIPLHSILRGKGFKLIIVKIVAGAQQKSFKLSLEGLR
jgi:hypothetical protein